MNLFRADLHCHSNCSDGSDDPLQLLRKAKVAMLQGLSITDHDTIAAYTPELFVLAESLSIRILTGVEISSEYEGAPVHILGYGYDLASPALSTFLKEMQERRSARNRAILKKLADRNIHIDEELLQGNSVGRPHIAAFLVKKGHVGSIQEAFERYLKDGASCWVSGFRLTPQEAIEQIRKAGGKAVLAHPHVYKKGSLLKKILAHHFDGIECYYSNKNKALELPWLKIAEERGWIVTGGSDYHGSIKPHICLGASWVGESTFNALAALS